MNFRIAGAPGAGDVTGPKKHSHPRTPGMLMLGFPINLTILKMLTEAEKTNAN